MLLYVFFFLNLDFVESYWLAKKRSDYVLYYSTAKSAIKIRVVQRRAYGLRDEYLRLKILTCRLPLL